MPTEKKRVADASTLAGYRQKVLRLAVLQQKLFDAVQVAFVLFKQKHGGEATVGKFARELSLPWSDVNKSLKRQQAVCGGKILTNLTAAINDTNLKRCIQETSVGLPDRVQGLALFSPEVINLALDLKIAFAQETERFNTERFTALFGAQQAVVKRVLLLANDGLTELKKKPVRQKIQNILCDPEWHKRLNQAHREFTEMLQRKGEKLKELTRQLRPYFASVEKLARTLEVHPSTLNEACRGQASEQTVDMLLTAARDLLLAQSENLRSSLVIEPKPPTAGKLLKQHGGITTKQGVKFVLTPETFQELEGDPGNAFVNYARRAFEMTRFVLNVGAQIQNSRVRKRIREELGSEVEELYAAIEVFSFAHPNSLLPIYKAQRETFRRKGNGGSKSGKRRKGGK